MNKQNGPGRPKKTLEVLPENWQQGILDRMKEGASLAEVKVYLDISNDLFNRFLHEETEFSETISKGKLLAEAWWNKKGRLGLENRSFNSSLWYLNMKNRFGWCDKQSLEVNAKVKQELGATLSVQEELMNLFGKLSHQSESAT